MKSLLACVTIASAMAMAMAMGSAATVTATAAAADINICDNMADNMFVADISNCSKYYICRDQTPISQTCGENRYFDASQQSCVVDASHCLTCDPSKLTTQPLAKTCNKFVMCFAGEPVLRQCADNLQFNAAAGNCDLATNVDCVENHCSIVNDMYNIVYVPSEVSCNKFYICMNGAPLAQHCNEELVFNSDIDACDLPSNFNCTVKLSKRTMTPAVRIPPTLVDISCPAEGTHLYPHEQANQYYMCVNGKGAALACAEGLYYDSKAESCRELANILRD